MSQGQPRSSIDVSLKRRAAIASIDRTISSLEAMRAMLLTEEQYSGQWRTTGHATFEAWRGQTAGIGARAARRESAIAATLSKEPEVRRAVAENTVTIGHAGVIAATAQRASRLGIAAFNAQDRSDLLALAQRHDVDSFAKAVDRWLAARDAVAHDLEHEQIRARRFLTVAHTPRGTHIKGLLDPVAGHTFKLALEAATAKPSADDTRDFTQRAADALSSLAEHALASGNMKNGALVRPHVSLIVSEQSFVESRRELARRGELAERGASGALAAPTSLAPSAAGEPPDSSRARDVPAQRLDRVFHTPATLEDGTPLPLTETARLLCDAEITRIVVDADSVPTNLGRSVRLYSREQRRAVVARDRGCRFEGCHQPARWCEVHHIAWWDRDNGETSVENGILLCSFHHHEVHRHHLSVTRERGEPPRVSKSAARNDRPAVTRPAAIPPAAAPPATAGPATVVPIKAVPIKAGPIKAGPAKAGPVRASTARHGEPPTTSDAARRPAQTSAIQGALIAAPPPRGEATGHQHDSPSSASPPGRRPPSRRAVSSRRVSNSDPPPRLERTLFSPMPSSLP